MLDTKGYNQRGKKHSGGQNGLDSVLVHSPDVPTNHSSHQLPKLTCGYSGGCTTRLAWPKIQRIMDDKANPEDWFCFNHKKEAKKSEQGLL